MIYPKFLKQGDTIGITAPSDGIIKEFDKVRLELACQKLNSLGYKNAVNESSDTWPYNYIMKAMELGLTRDVNIENFSKPANRGDIAIMALKAYSLK